jgi:hypothetical protein
LLPSFFITLAAIFYIYSSTLKMGSVRSRKTVSRILVDHTASHFGVGYSCLHFTLFCAGPLERAVMAFSVRKNTRELLAGLPAEGDINCIYGVRALCTIALYLAHKVITLAFSPYVNRVQLTEVIGKNIRLFSLSLGPTQSPIQWVPGPKRLIV